MSDRLLPPLFILTALCLSLWGLFAFILPVDVLGFTFASLTLLLLPVLILLMFLTAIRS